MLILLTTYNITYGHFQKYSIKFSLSGRSAAWFSAPAWGAGGRRFKSRRPDIFFRAIGNQQIT